MKKNLIISTLLCAMATALGVNDPRDTRTIAIDIDTTLTTCCATLAADFKGTFTAIMALENLLQTSECPAVLIGQAQIGATGYTITTSGVYKLSQNIRFSPVGAAAAITINADNVLLDLQCFTIAQTNNIPAVDGISIAANHTNVVVHNGKIQNFTRDGIRVASGSSNLAYADITIQNCLYGISCLGTGVAPIKDMRAVGLDFLSNSTGVSLSFVNRAEFSECTSFGTLHAGFELINSFSNSIDSCSIENTGAATGSAFGVSLISGGNNRVQNCYIDGVSTKDTFSGNSAVGILIGATENDDLIINNQISNVMTTSNAQPFGIEMLYSFTALDLVTQSPSLGAGFPPDECHWSPNGRYLVGTASLGLNVIYQYSNNLLKEIQRISGASTNASAWSPDGSYLALSGPLNLEIYQVNEGIVNQVAQITIPLELQSLSWSSDGKYIAAGSAGPGILGFIFSFDGTTLAEVASFNSSSGTNGVFVSWSPVDPYLVAINSPGQGTVYKFSGNSLQQVASFALGVIIEFAPVSWSADGKFFVTESTGPICEVYSFSGTSVQSIARSSSFVGAARNYTWSPDGQYIAVASGPTGPATLTILKFNGTSLPVLTAQALAGGGSYNQGLDWSLLGNLIAVGVGTIEYVYSGFQFPSGTTFKNNKIFNIRGPALPQGQPGVSSGRGLSASSANNLIINNTVFDADLSYVFVNNIFEQFVTNASPEPSLLSNLSFPPL